MTVNQNPEQQARDRIDAQLRAAGWAVQKKIDFSAGAGQAVREWQTDVGPADYVPTAPDMLCSATWRKARGGADCQPDTADVARQCGPA